MRAIDCVRQAYLASGRREIPVPEWSTDEHNFTIYFTPITPAEEEAIRVRDPKPGAEYNVAVIIQKAHDAHGQPLFTWGDKHALMTSCDYLTIIRLVNEMSRTLTEEEAKKNMRRIPGSDSAVALESASTNP
jgi:hypothetical protein